MARYTMVSPKNAEACHTLLYGVADEVTELHLTPTVSLHFCVPKREPSQIFLLDVDASPKGRRIMLMFMKFLRSFCPWYKGMYTFADQDDIEFYAKLGAHITDDDDGLSSVEMQWKL